MSRRLPPPTEENLKAYAMRYLARFAASEARLRTLLARRADKAAAEHGIEDAMPEAAIANVLADMRRLGFVDDRLFAEARARSLNQRGQPPRMIRARLSRQGVDTDTIDGALERLADDLEGDPERVAAIALARRRRLGPFAVPDRRAERRERDLAIMARAGYGYEVATSVIDAATPEALLAEEP
ncbi:regulatory protein RecX [Marinivivus vitaminiproducens]|uniref:regulatory protein RecX n=1 Tax=Marinivivus vitaminiproducens TaxID=3035935 RepID=UPI0027A9249D|nr:regulatory protein RecX [Geminicoccaceae bacterium SCSIO 64248]